jgi:SAM-dependent methyltransferase
MDLRSYIKDDRLIERAKQFALRGLLNYQPWIFSDTLETGVGLEWRKQDYVGLTYWPDIDRRLLHSPQLRRLLIHPTNYADFHEANSQLRRLYDGIADEICAKIGNVTTRTFLDVGCNSGYLPQSFLLRGAREAAGCDREKGFAETFELLNEILQTKANFYDPYFDPRAREIRGVQPHDIVISMAVLCHQADPLSHLAALASVAKAGLFVWTFVNNDPGYTIHLGEPSGQYPEDQFPLCFDCDTIISEALLRKSFLLLGFKEIYDMPARTSGLPTFAWHGMEFRGLLALR